MEVLHLFVLLAFSSHVFVVNSQLSRESFEDNKFNVSWIYDKSRGVLAFQVDVDTVGWVGLGFSSMNTSMKDLDVVVGGKTIDGKEYLHDLNSNSKARPSADSKNNYNLTKVEEANGKTTLWFQRELDTMDKDDLQFTANTPVYLAYAYHDKDDAMDASTFLMHTKRGYSTTKFDLLSVLGPNATATVTSPPTDAADVKTTPPPTSGEGKTTSALINVALSTLFVSIALV